MRTTTKNRFLAGRTGFSEGGRKPVFQLFSRPWSKKKWGRRDEERKRRKEEEEEEEEEEEVEEEEEETFENRQSLAGKKGIGNFSVEILLLLFLPSVNAYLSIKASEFTPKGSPPKIMATLFACAVYYTSVIKVKYPI